MEPQELINQKIDEAIKLIEEAEKVADENSLEFELSLTETSHYYGTGNETLKEYARNILCLELKEDEESKLEGRWVSSSDWC